MDNLRGSVIGTLDLDTISRDHDDSVVDDSDDFQNHANIDLIPQKECGNDSDDRILNGNKTEPFQFPWMVIIQILQGVFFFRIIKLFCKKLIFIFLKIRKFHKFAAEQL